MNDNIDKIKDYLKCSSSHSVITDENLKIIWTSSQLLNDRLIGTNAVEIFPDEFNIPEKNCLAKGNIDGTAYLCKITYYNKKYVIEMFPDDISDFWNNSFFHDLIKKINYDIRTSVSNICTHSTMLYDILKGLECTEEIDHLNIQRGNCYKILNSISVPCEAAKYSDPVCIKRSPVSLTDILESFEEIFLKSFQNSSVAFSYPENIFVNAHKERLMYSLIELLSRLIENDVIRAEIKAEKTDGYIFITVQKFNSDAVPEKFRLFSHDNFPYKSNQTDFLLTDLFCRYFSSELYIKKFSGQVYAAVLKIPAAEPDLTSLAFCSYSTEYGDNNFSPIHIAFSDLFNYRYYDIPPSV